MKITVSQLRRIIREEVERSLLREGTVNIRDVKNFIVDYGPNAGMIAGASPEEIRGWFEGNKLDVPDDIEEFRSAVIKAIPFLSVEFSTLKQVRCCIWLMFQ